MTALVITVALALIFTFTNGFHDSANAIAVSIATRALKPAVALLIAAAGNLIGAFFGGKVAATIGHGIINLPTDDSVMLVVAASLVGAIAWNLITWRWGLPSSSSHALIGGMVGAALVAKSTVLWSGVVEKVVIPMVASPIVGFIGGYIVMLSFMWIFRRVSPPKARRGFRYAQWGSASAMSFGHGMQDAAKTMGIVVLALNVAGAHSGSSIPVWVFLTCAGVLSIGTATGGFKIMKTMGSKIVTLDPPQGFAAEAVGSAVLFGASMGFGAPISTTHAISAAIMGVGATRRLSAVNWKVAVNMVKAWVFTFPGAAAIAAVTWYIGAVFQ
ncbi:MAG: inorganic phosphate transporter [Nakamurella sp.]